MDRDLKMAIVFDDLIQRGGAERLLTAISEHFPRADVFTSLATDFWLDYFSEKNVSLHTSFMQKLPFKKTFNRFYSIFGLHILAFESMDFSDYDLVLSVSSRYAHGVITKPETKHVCYMNSPSRQFWDTISYFSKESFWVRKFRFLLDLFLNHARVWDYTAAQRIDFFIANSEVPAKRIKKYYGKSSYILYPFVDSPPREIVAKKEAGKNKDYYLIISRLTSWKRVDIAVEACVEAGINLKIAGEGPARSKLEKGISDNEKIEFLGYISEETKWELLSGCKALIMTQVEDFGITPLEAMAVGKPVIAYRKGGALVTVLPGETGEFFDSQDANSLGDVLKKFDPEKYNSQVCKNRAAEFSKEKFNTSLNEILNKVYLDSI